MKVKNEVTSSYKTPLLTLCVFGKDLDPSSQEQKNFAPLGTKLYFHVNSWRENYFIIRSKFFLFFGREPTTWPTNNCLQIMVCSCAMSSNCVKLVFGCKYYSAHAQKKPRFSPSCDCSCVKMASEDIHWKKQIRWSNDKTIIELGYRKISWFVTVVSQMSYLLATDKSRYFAQPCPIIV